MDYDGKRVKRVSQQMAGRHGHLRCGNNANKTAYMAWEQDESVFYRELGNCETRDARSQT